MCRRERGKGDRDESLKESEGEVQKGNEWRHAREEKEIRKIGTGERHCRRERIGQRGETYSRNRGRIKTLRCAS